MAEKVFKLNLMNSDDSKGLKQTIENNQVLQALCHIANMLEELKEQQHELSERIAAAATEAVESTRAQVEKVVKETSKVATKVVKKVAETASNEEEVSSDSGS